MSENTGGSKVVRFAERAGINRKRATLAAALLGSLLVVSLIMMNQRNPGPTDQCRATSRFHGAGSIGGTGRGDAACRVGGPARGA